MEPDRRFADCSYCGASSVLDLGTAATCFSLEATLDEDAARAKLLASLRERELHRDAEVLSTSRLVVPFWVLRTPGGDRALLAADRADLPLPRAGRGPAGQLGHFAEDETGGVDVVEPTVPMPAALARLGSSASDQGTGSEGVGARLVYVPFARVGYRYGGAKLEAYVDTASGAVHAASWPHARKRQLEKQLGSLLGLTVAVYVGLAALVPGALLTLIAYLVASGGLYWLFERHVVSSEKGR